MRLPDGTHFSHPWRIHALAADFDLEDVWALPTPGRKENFPRLVEQFVSRGEPGDFPVAFRALFALRWQLGKLFGWDQEGGGTDGRVPSLRERLPPDLRDGPRGPDITAVPGRDEPQRAVFDSVYLTGDEWVAELANKTVHGLLHIGWVESDDGHNAQMAVLVKPAGWFGRAYLAAIKPFRLAIVYPMLLETIGRQWQTGLGSKGGGRS
ncbi:DUF2867 domain-containing protein [Solirubrobacter sp. CPCC 204708]|uniref:DUF2867 domain-containing protein n=1 Tax=Solirubrobacter deserti TaxID=2282478 RepID=A0ABT4RKE8_9ACTN|nr:DUF2867 domain-containing protein [Solirubrobacter deserti]MBE2317298.1 DUF2867 domain-containing protein [Solirubrobacter deserti]MDA0139027.1 DUF2867 domain-containing protein [Solirubrobacter deserti]